ncbi:MULTISPECIES: restriction endonuclease subunit S [Acinetobacter]|uniref:restriction endonuclease subunit S n=1 Tax=Acinetobacter TaxID=469 RepID=UPI0001B8E496|nr:restriction endonuclease subunit S [Acinetobacter sp. RUH 2624]EEX01143.1 hypothetical protein HMPREF0014_00498 [Acinetobacter sp. RUH 2624]
MEQVLYKLPDGWDWKTLGDVCFKVTDGSHNPPKEVEVGLPMLSSRNVMDNGLVWDNFRLIPEDAFESEHKRTRVSEGDVLLTIVGTIGRSCVVRNLDRLFTLQRSVAVLSSEELIPEFLSYQFRAPFIQEHFISNAKGSAQKGIYLKQLKATYLVCPPIEEQNRIVEKLDALFTRIDIAIEHLQSKLDLSKQLFDSVLDEFFKLPDCDSVPLTQVVEFIGGSQPPKSQFSDVQKEGYVRLIQIRDYKSDNHIVYVDSASTKKFCTKDDVMIGRYGPPVFQILRGLDGAYNVALMKAVPNEDLLMKDYLFWFLQSPSIQNYVIGISQRAAGQSGVNKKALEKYLIPVPSKAIQNDIVDKVGQLVSKSRHLEAEVTAEIAFLSQLKASILDSAFKGEL